MGFLANIETAVTSNFTAIANTFGAGLLGTFRPGFIIGFTIWITLIAYEVAFGKSDDGFTYIFTKIGKIFIIGVLALYGWPEVAYLLNAVKDGFVGANTISKILETNLINPMVLLWSELWRWLGSALAPYGWADIMSIMSVFMMFFLILLLYAFMALLVAGFGVVALAMFLVAHVVFILLMAIGPFFLLCLAFPFLQRFFETYIGHVMTAILAMAFTVLMVVFVANLFGLVNIHTIVPVAADLNTVSNMTKQMAVLFAAKGATALLIIYLYFKVFDLAAGLGGGLNMGNNLVGGVRSIMRDLSKSAGGGARNNNAIGQGAGGSSSGGASHRARGANSTFTGMGVSAASRGISGTAQGATKAAQMMLKGASNIGRYAYNRYANNANRISAS